MKSSDSAEDLLSAYNTTCGATSPRRCYETDNFIRRYDSRLIYDTDHNEIYPEYHHRDHLGNTRLAFTDRNEDKLVEIIGNGNEVTQVLDFYPFGLAQMSTVVAAGESSNRYRYNGKEFSEKLGLYDYGARWYDPSIARWTSVDPLADKFGGWSPYNYVLGNPVRLVDPDGRSPIIPNPGLIGQLITDY